MLKNEFTVVSLYSGAMGLDMGLEQTGRFRVLACVEKDAAAEAALATYAREHQLLIQGCRQGVGQQGAAKVKECVDAVLAQPAQGK